MLTNLRLLFGLLWQPLPAIRTLRDRAPVAFAAGAALLMTWIYSLVVVVMAGYVMAGAKPQLAPEMGSPAYGARSLFAAALVGSSVRALMTAMMIVLFIAVIYVPVVILIANLFEQRAGFSLVVREEYAAMASCALMSQTVSLLITVLPAILIGWTRNYSNFSSVVITAAWTFLRRRGARTTQPISMPKHWRRCSG